ncbi:haloacid dehalogenase-like hydrolase family protein [Mycobacterium xenopi 3993]|nr:haloacid dehalogenase-like hydrolase family protein [Mycobacterium xenopi 3993]
MHHTLASLGLGQHTDAAIAAYRADYSTRGWVNSRVFAGIKPLLADLRAAGVRLAVATSKAEPTARRILAHVGIAEHFDVVAGPASTGLAAARPTCWLMPWPSCSRCPSGWSWSATAGMTWKALPPTASTRWSSGGDTGRPTSPRTARRARRTSRPSPSCGGR